MRVAIIACMLALSLAGCTDSGPGTALALQGDADKAALKVDGAAELIAVFGPEWTDDAFGDKFEEESPEAAAMNQGIDETPGDGLANAWGFLYASAGEPILVIVDGGGNILFADSIDPDSNTAGDYDDYTVLANVEIDSDEAATVVRENSEDFTAMLEQPDVVVIMALGQSSETPDPYWVFTAHSGNEEDFTFALVNARDGSYLDFSGWLG